MIPAGVPIQRSASSRLLLVDGEGAVTDHARAEFPDLVYKGDLVIANDAATLPASLSGFHVPTDAAVEVRLAGRDSLSANARQKLRGRRIRRRRFSHADGTPATPSGPAARGRTPVGAATRRCRERARASTPDRDAISGLGRSHLGGPGALWAAHPVCARLTTARDLGCVDANRQPAGRVRASVSGLHSQLGHDSVTSFTSRAVRHPDARRWNFINGRSRSRSASPVR